MSVLIITNSIWSIQNEETAEIKQQFKRIADEGAEASMPIYSVALYNKPDVFRLKIVTAGKKREMRRLQIYE